MCRAKKRATVADSDLQYSELEKQIEKKIAYTCCFKLLSQVCMSNTVKPVLISHINSHQTQHWHKCEEHRYKWGFTVISYC